jgi:hypothetical protein
LTSKTNALEACESYEVYQTPVEREEDGEKASTGEVEVDRHLLVLLRGVEQFVYDTLLNMMNIL